ncbi:uncharacterized protein LOC115453131 [Manduca sexta]|uniref:uncharacterized protein LOC115453131 n=1 Tax=Manduca sexta TaxID=7130 RepID=UPI001182A730|nr:uncharacterized protein LOC115453131 [Manduca sexta]
MADDEERLLPMLFFQETTGKRDFRHGEIKPKIETVYQGKSKCIRIRPPPLKYFHTMNEWKAPTLPMELFVTPKDVVRTNPRLGQRTYERPPDLNLAQVRKTRPRLVMTPAVSIDDMEDEDARQILLKNIYKATATKSMEDTAAYFPINSVQAPFPGLPAAANPFVFPKLNPSYVSPEWRMDSVTWEKKRLRAYCNPTKDFWMDQQLPQCRACREYATMKAYRTKRRQMKPGNR